MVAFSQMKEKLYTVDQAREVLATTEPIRDVPIPVGDTRFFLEPSWNHAANTLEGTDRVAASAVINGEEFPLTKDAVLQATSSCGLSKAYVLRTPAELIELHLNYWYGGGLESKDLKLMVAQGNGAAVTRGTVTPFSNLRILDETLAGIENRFGRGDIFVDKKFHHSLSRTHLRLVIPSSTFVIEDTGISNDEWSLGLNIRNSLTGAPADQTTIEGYLFRWWCTNGAIDTRASSGKWNRRIGGQDEAAVYEWARKSVDDVLGGLETAFDSLQDMARLPLGANASQVLRDTFRGHKIALRERELILNNLVNSGNPTAYSLMNSITSAANGDNVDAKDRQILMEAGGDVPHALADRCNSCHRALD